MLIVSVFSQNTMLIRKLCFFYDEQETFLQESLLCNLIVM